MKISLIAAVSENGVMGRQNDLPWHLPDDFAYFKQKTVGHPIIMGRKSFDSLGKPLPKRPNIIITRNPNVQVSGATVVSSLNEAFAVANQTQTDEIFVIGGAEIYALAFPQATHLYLTEIHKKYEGDTYFPPFDRREWREISRHHHPADARHETDFDFVVYERNPNV